MFAVIKTGGKQYRVKPGDLLVVEKLDGDPGSEIRFDQVLMMGDGDDVTVGAPTVANAVVNAVLLETRTIRGCRKLRWTWRCWSTCTTRSPSPTPSSTIWRRR